MKFQHIKNISRGVVLGALFFFGASTSQAASLTATQIQSVVQLLQSFNADTSAINVVVAALGTPVSTPTTSCPPLSFNLYEGVSDAVAGGQVSALQQYLGISPTGYFGSLTRARVAALQSQNAVYPVTGGVGPRTRSLIARLCGAGTPTPAPTPTPTNATFFTLGTPFSLSSGQTGIESQARQLTIQLSQINLVNGTIYSSSSSVQVVLGLDCAQGTQCFYHPQQTTVITLGQSVLFQGYVITLSALTGAGATFTVTPGSSVTPTPTITSISPAVGSVGTSLTIYGSGFTNDNTVHFGTGGLAHVPSTNSGTMMTYTIPAGVGPCDLINTSGPVVCSAMVTQLQPGVYPVSVANLNGTSGQVFVTVSGQNIGGSGTYFTQPITGQMATRGQDLLLAWNYGSTDATSLFGSNRSVVVLDLYTEVGSKVGTIAIPSAAQNTYSWHIPGFPQNYMCTMQYPNGLCGVNIPTGRYYIKATVTSDGFNPSSATTYAVAQSGTFTISQQ